MLTGGVSCNKEGGFPVKPDQSIHYYTKAAMLIQLDNHKKQSLAEPVMGRVRSV